ncbi:acyl-CoA dehydrogenase family protein [Sphingopyxis sp.]|uniref:acyl-CoA dehydrogenase family protein n=1 Tax=Sphingopyxis sp. TaxID=1908224 RepID=UPI00262D3B53|nr:acyl-CoA dehydrogenase family protein [Sphingopyxis sp.]MCW0200092.1 acyl-CoA/acyl-ACP dehydrogenase [Sphingopyxis sp.]
MNFAEQDHIDMLRDTIRRFVEKRMPREDAARWDKDNHFPREIFDELGELGVMGLTVPEDYGGAGRDIVATMMVIEELSKRSLAVAIPYIMSACYAGMNLVECASERQKRELLPRVAAGKLIFAYGWTEPDVGADLASVQTVIARDGDELVINGEKRFCSGANICDYIYVLGRSGPKEDRYRNLSLVMVPADAPGVEITPIEGLGLKGAPTTDVRLIDVRVPVGNLMGEEKGWNTGWSMVSGAGLDVEKLEVAAMAAGIATAATDDAWAYVQERKQFGKPIATYQSIRHKLADMRTQGHAARLMLYDAASMANRHVRCGTETSMAKLFATEAARSIVLSAQDIFGAYGYVKGFDIERYVRDVLALPIIGGSSAVQRNNVVNWLGLPR